MDMANEKKESKRTDNGSSNTDKQRSARRRNRGNGEKADWGAASAELVLRLVVSVAKIGGAVQFGYTQSGDSFVIRVLGDGEPFNEYLRSTEDVDLWLTGFCLDYEEDGTSPPRS
jgi:hypothetical protein